MYYFFYLPLGTEGDDRRFPAVTASLAVTLAVIHYLLHWNRPTVHLFEQWVLYTAAPTLPQAFLACFVHAGLWHLIGNLLYLFTFGPALERRIPSWLFLGFYLLCGLLSMVCQVELGPRMFPNEPPTYVLGASGAISGLLGMCLLRCWFVRLRVAHATFAYLQGMAKAGVLGIPLWIGVSVWGLLQVVELTVSLEAGSRGAATWAHLGGLGVGVALALVTGLAREGRRERRLHKARRHMERGSWYAALGELEAFRKDAGVRPEVLHDEARCLRLAGRHEEAHATYERVLTVHMKAGRWRPAADVAEEMLRTSTVGGPHPRRLIALGRVLERDDDLFRAAVFYERAGLMEGDPIRSAVTLERAAELYRRQVGDLERAAELFTEGAERLLSRRDAPPDPMTLARVNDLKRRSGECRRVLTHRQEPTAYPRGSALAGESSL